MQTANILYFVLLFSSVASAVWIFQRIEGSNSNNTVPSWGVVLKNNTRSPSTAGSRRNGILWKKDETLYTGFGLTGAIETSQNSVFSFNLSSSQWSFIGGASTSTSENPATQSTPGSRSNLGATALDANGNLILFGGLGCSSLCTTPLQTLGDIWIFNITANQFTSAGGLKSGDNRGNERNPATRRDAASWYVNGAMYLFGGFGMSNQLGYLSDVWQMTVDGRVWTSISGNGSANATGVYGEKGSPSINNLPAARSMPATWTDPSGKLYLFGGQDPDGMRTDVWMFDVTTFEWTWLSGSQKSGGASVVGQQGVFGATFFPRGRIGSVTWRDPMGRLFLFGGSSGNGNTINDVWCFDPSISQWAWMGGPLNTNDVGNETWPSARYGTSFYQDNDGTVYIYGGALSYSPQSPVLFDDMWTITQVPDEEPPTLTTLYIIVIVLSCVLFVMIVAIVAFFLLRYRRKIIRRSQISPRGSVQLENMSPHATIILRSSTFGAKDLLSDVTIESPLASGNFGQVFVGNFGSRKVALKSLTEIQSEELEREASILKSLNHPNIVRYYGFAQIRAEMYIVMEYASEGSLKTLLKTYNPTRAELIQWVRDVACGMRYLAVNKIVHKDLALRNLLLTRDDMGNTLVMVSDFGLATTLNSIVKQKDAPLPLKWTAPEILLHERPSLASDVWSYGIVMWEMYSQGQTPYPGMSNDDAVNSVMEGHRLESPQGCPQPVYDLMMECWQRDPQERPTFARIIEKVDVIAKKEGLSQMTTRKRSVIHRKDKELVYENT
eukprot:TRINITY_DN3829_c0_g1_i1.p1 TRINITY_DN3829_c0_g1~~TRINITY_DN3829_c0_g1_i1.p1  ORF type:complete len:780 (-),score=197.66 TRINITY_DN3829_c0_g1_i1:108-2447(-)